MLKQSEDRLNTQTPVDEKKTHLPQNYNNFRLITNTRNKNHN